MSNIDNNNAKEENVESNEDIEKKVEEIDYVESDKHSDKSVSAILGLILSLATVCRAYVPIDWGVGGSIAGYILSILTVVFSLIGLKSKQKAFSLIALSIFGLHVLATLCLMLLYFFS